MLFLTDGIAKGGAALLILLQSFPEDFHFLSFFGNSNNYVRDILTCMYDNDMKKCMDSPLFSYILLAVAVVVSALVFVRAAIKYRLRTRDVEPYNPIA